MSDIVENQNEDKCNDVPIYHKLGLTIEEASKLSNIGINKLRELTNDKDCPFVFRNGNKKIIKRKQLEKFIDKITYI